MFALGGIQRVFIQGADGRNSNAQGSRPRREMLRELPPVGMARGRLAGVKPHPLDRTETIAPCPIQPAWISVRDESNSHASPGLQPLRPTRSISLLVPR